MGRVCGLTPQLSEIRKGVDDSGRIGSDGRRQVYLHAAGRAPVPFGQVRPVERHFI